MFDEVIIDMKNGNSLIALAYIKENDNPLSVFCKYIEYCLATATNYILRHDELAQKIQDEFGLVMPQQMIKICVKILINESKIKKLIHGAGYELVDGAFDVGAFDHKRAELKQMEEELINDLVVFVSNYKKEWSYDEAREHLTFFLISKEQAYNLFVNGSVQSDKEEKYIPPEWYIGKYITHVLEENNIFAQYLLDIVNGLMIYIGIHQTQDYNNERTQIFRGTDFYIDTKILLRVMGFSWQLEIDAAKEMLDIITKEYKGNICVFEHTIGEIESALSNAAYSLKNGQSIFDDELRAFSSLKKCDAFNFQMYSDTARDIILEQLKIRIQPSIEWGDKNTHKHNLDWDALNHYIQERHPKWKSRAIKNDVETINYINILRKGNYQTKFGGKKKLPIFITSNSMLVWDMRNYILMHGEEDKGTANWNVSALPIISDNMLICRLWVPKAKSLVSIPTLTLARNAYAAQQTTPYFFIKLKESAEELRQHNFIDVINISNVRKAKLDEIVIKHTSGDSDEITPDIIATSMDEMIAMETMELNESISNLEDERNQNTLTISQQRQQIILSTSKRFINKIGSKKILIYAAQEWWILNTLLFGGLSLLLSLNKSVFTSYMVLFVALSLILKVSEKFLHKSSITDFFLKIVVSRVWNGYTENVKAQLENMETDLESEILNTCRIETKLFNKYMKFCNIDS